MHCRSIRVVLPLVLILVLPASAQKRPMTWEDMMHFRAVEEVQLSDDGSFVAFSAVPDRGDSEAIVVSTDGRTRYTIERGRAPQITPDGRWVATRVEPLFMEAERAKNGKDQPKPGLELLDTQTGESRSFERVESFAFSSDGSWLALLRHADADTTGADTTAADTTASNGNGSSTDWKGAPLVLLDLSSGVEHQVNDIGKFAWASQSPRLALTIQGPDSLSTELRLADLSTGGPHMRTLHAEPGSEYDNLTWTGEHAGSERLSFLTRVKPEKGVDAAATAYLWSDDSLSDVDLAAEVPEGWIVPLSGSLSFSRDGERLFVGARPQHEPDADDDESADTTGASLFVADSILTDATVDVWHVDDPRIMTQQRQVWNSERNATFPTVYHIGERRAVKVGDPERQPLGTPDNPRTLLATNPNPYYPFVTWEGFFSDVYAIDLRTGEEELVARRLSGRPFLSPDGRYVVYYESGQWHAYDTGSDTSRNLTDGLDVSFADEDHDAPSEPSGYGIGGWVEDDAVLIYDKFDVWQIPLSGGTAQRLTDGRREQRRFRVIQTDRDQEFFAADEELLLSSYHDRDKNYGFYRGRVGGSGTERLLEEDRRFNFLSMADEAPVIIYTREGFDEFPDLWATDMSFRQTEKLTDVNPQMAEFKWGTSELVEWTNTDGVPLQGVVIKPEDYDPTRRYPVIVYYYELFSQRLHEFNRPQINHRPSFPLYVGEDYVLFLPDVVFEVGQPGFSAVKSLVPGVQRLVDLGIADPERIGLHGHSWSGYQTAFVVTETDIFNTAIAGAPVSNMTSAYSGIRWGSGMARQFQYEMQQSRLGRSMWEARDLYIENSPVFFADRINTPLLIIHGDDDGAVPWYQSIELYLAMRRLGKEAVFLQYRGEDHHPAAYPNKLDWAMRMKEWFDHYLKGETAEWIEEGELYAGD